MLLPPSQQMTHNTSKKKNARFYSLTDETALLKFLSTRKASADMNYSQSDWNAAATVLNRDNIKTDSELRTFESCKAKYRQLKSIYDVVKAVRSNSAWKWDDEKGADINLDSKGAWDDYVAGHPRASSFRNKGWSHLAFFDDLGGASPKGLQDPSNRISEAARASQGPSVAGSSQFAHTHGSEEREDGPHSQAQAGEAPPKRLHAFRISSQGPSVAGSSKPTDTQGPEEREDSPPQSQAGEAPPKGLHVFRASQAPSVAGSSKPADTQGRKEREDSSPPWVTIESESQSQVDEENMSNDEGKLSSPLAVPATPKRKRASNTGPTTRKKPRVSASTQAFGDFTAAFQHASAVIEKAFETNFTTSPKRKTDTMKLAIEREKDWLTKRQIAILLDVFEKEPLATEGYQLVQDDDELRKEWVCVKLDISLD